MAKGYDTLANSALAGLGGILIGGVISSAILPGPDSTLSQSSYVNQDGKTISIIKAVNSGVKDMVFVDVEGDGRYISLEEYSLGIDNKYDRRIEQAKIEKFLENQGL